MSFYHKKQFFDLKNISHISHTSATMRKEVAYEYRQNRFCSVDGFYSILRVSAMRRALSWQLQGKNLLLLGSVPVHVLCTTDLSGKSQGYRGMPASSENQTLSHGYSWQNLPKHTCSCQRDSRLENLRRLCSGADQNSQKTLFWRRFWAGTRPYSLCPRCNDYRSLSFGLPLGQISQWQSRSETPYSAGFARQYPCYCQYYAWQNSRYLYNRQSFYRGWRHLYNGPSLCRFFSPLQDSPISSVLCNRSKKQLRIQASVFLTSRQINRCASRPDNYRHRVLHLERLSRQTAANKLFRCLNKKTVRFLNQQLLTPSNRYRQIVQMPLANRTVLQMDQAAPKNQGILWHYRKRRQNSNLDSYLHLCAGSYRQETALYQSQPLHNFTDFERHAFRENAHFTGSFGY